MPVNTNNIRLVMKKLIIVLAGFILFLVPLNAQDESEEKTIRPFQLSLIPGIGTEGIYSTDNIYNLSFNIFAGLTGGVDGLEIGGFMNINRFSMNGFQASGFGNIVNGTADGLQAAGFFNLNNLYTNGLQVAGFANVVNYDANVLQVSGFANVIDGHNAGIQASGFFNFTAFDGDMVQAAGFMNYTGGVLKGVQAAGFANIAREVDGMQAAGFLNIARKVNGLQVGMVNIADSLDGLPLGLLSIVRGGYRKAEFSVGDALNLHMGFKIGVKRFYNIFSMGTQFTGERSAFLLGYGIGSEFNHMNDQYINIEMHSNQVVKKGWLKSDGSNMLHQLKVSYAKDLDPRWQFFIGPVLNIQTVRADPETGEWINFSPYSILDFSSDRRETRLWLGVNLGVRFW